MIKQFYLTHWWDCDNTDSAPRYINFFETISLLGRWSSSGSDRGIAYFFQGTEIQSREWEKKNKLTNEQYA